MNIDLVRKIDYWAGIPACWVLSLLAVFSSSLKTPSLNPKKFLFVELSEMGSAILAYPTMKALKKQFPTAELFFLIFEKNRPSVDILKLIPEENVLVIKEKSPSSFLFSVLNTIRRIRKEQIDCVFDLELFTRVSAILTFLSGAPVRVGFHKFRMEGLYRGHLHTHQIQYNFQQHISKSFLSFVKVLGTPTKNWPAMDEAIADEELETASYLPTFSGQNQIRNKLKLIFPELHQDHRLILFNPSAGEIPIRAWPVEKYIELGKRLIEEPRNLIVLIGAGVDWETTQKVYQALAHERCLQLTGKTSFSELMDLFSISEVLITNDSGPAHFASMTAVKNFVFFGPETPRLYGPLGQHPRVIYSNFPCSPCLTAYNHRNTPCKENKCLRVISVDYVFDLVHSCL